MDFDIRPAGPEDLPAIIAIQSQSPEAAHWDAASFLTYDCRLAVSDVVLAFLVTRPTAPGEREILNLAVHPSHRRKGIARKMVESALRAASADWFLEVRESNTAAIRLYQSLGFRQAGTRSKYYSDPPESGIVMKLRS